MYVIPLEIQLPLMPAFSKFSNIEAQVRLYPMKSPPFMSLWITSCKSKISRGFLAKLNKSMTKTLDRFELLAIFPRFTSCQPSCTFVSINQMQFYASLTSKGFYLLLKQGKISEIQRLVRLEIFQKIWTSFVRKNSENKDHSIRKFAKIKHHISTIGTKILGKYKHHQY